MGTRLGLRREHADLLAQMRCAGCHEADFVLGLEHAVDDAHKHHDADVIIEPGVDDQALQGLGGIALGWRNACHDRFQDFVNPHACLGAGQDGLGGVDADDILDLGTRTLRVGLRQIHFVEHRDDLDPEFDRRVAVGDRLRLDPLRGINDKQRALAGRERAADFVGEIDVAGRVDQVQRVNLPTLGLVRQGGGLCLDRDAALALDIH